MSINFNNIDQYLYEWVTQYTSESARWAFQNGPKKDLPFILINKGAYVPIGRAYFHDLDATGYQIITTPVQLVVNFQAFGANSYGRLDAIKALGDNFAAQDALLVNGINLVDTSLPILNITTLVDEVYEERASTDLIFRFSVTYGEDQSIEVGVIEKVNVQATYNVCGEERNSLIEIDSTI